jgi:hypothetical protein
LKDGLREVFFKHEKDTEKNQQIYSVRELKTFTEEFARGSGENRFEKIVSFSLDRLEN